MVVLLVDELEFHCALQLQDRSRNVNGTFMSGWIMSSSYIFGASLAEFLRFAGVQHAFWTYKMRTSVLRTFISSSSSQL